MSKLTREQIDALTIEDVVAYKLTPTEVYDPSVYENRREKIYTASVGFHPGFRWEYSRAYQHGTILADADRIESPRLEDRVVTRLRDMLPLLREPDVAGLTEIKVRSGFSPTFEFTFDRPKNLKAASGEGGPLVQWVEALPIDTFVKEAARTVAEEISQTLYEAEGARLAANVASTQALKAKEEAKEAIDYENRLNALRAELAEAIETKHASKVTKAHAWLGSDAAPASLAERGWSRLNAQSIGLARKLLAASEPDLSSTQGGFHVQSHRESYKDAVRAAWRQDREDRGLDTNHLPFI